MYVVPQLLKYKLDAPDVNMRLVPASEDDLDYEIFFDFFLGGFFLLEVFFGF